MANSYFQFKQFKVNQDKSAMKVGTDGVLLGAWADCNGARKILDIGTGTGLIALMMAQRNPDAEIIAIDIDEGACEQARENFMASPWADRLTVVHSSLQDFVKSNTEEFEHVISNPPYFQNSLRSGEKSRDLARHTDSLSFEELFYCSNSLSTASASLSIIIPYVAESDVMTIKKNSSYNLFRRLHVQGDINKQVVRSLLEFRKEIVANYEEELLYIEKGKRHAYSEEYKALTRDFYLAF